MKVLNDVTHGDACSLEDVDDRSDKVCVIGAGASGLAATHRLIGAGLACDCLEREDDLGGNWNYGKKCSSVYASVYLISSKKLTQYPDFRMPEDWPEFPHHSLALEYLRNYAEKFGLYDHIQFKSGVRHLAPVDKKNPRSGWIVELESGQRRRYRAVMIANGHNWDPNKPDLPGSFDGIEIHSGDYKTPDLFRARRVLIVGGGNSGCDLAVESSQHADATRLSLRRGYHFIPKFFRGLPIDVCGESLLRWKFPLWLRRMIAHVAIFYLQGTRKGTGLPKPDHRLLETHPTVNSLLYYYLRHGALEVRPDVESLRGDRVRFVDGREEPFDVIVYATGFKLSFPFVQRELLNWREGRPDLFLNIFHPGRDDLFVLGMIQPDSGQWGLGDMQSRLVVEYLRGLERDSPAARRFRELKRRSASRSKIRYLDTSRHALEIEHSSYYRAMKKEWLRLRGGRGATVRQ